MKKVLYLTNIESPYRVRFFNELAKHCDLTVLYEREKSSNRNEEWSKSEQSNYRKKYLNGIIVKNESTFSFKILRELLHGYDHIIVGCYNSPVQMMAILVMRFLHIPYILNLDGEPFLNGKSIKSKVKRFFVRGADVYLVAGGKSAESLRTVVGNKSVIPYYFSSLSDEEIISNAERANEDRNDTILVVGQYFDYKGMDVALETAQLDKSLRYKFVGMGNRTELFLQDFDGEIPSNVEFIPFLQKTDLEREYQSCRMLVLPSRQECWGLVINEAASFGTPIVSTWGSGAAVEFMADEYPQYLAQPGDTEDLYRCIQLLNGVDKEAYSKFLMEKTAAYTIERSVQAHLLACSILTEEN